MLLFQQSRTYVLRDEPVKPEEILQDFFDEKRSKEKILLAERLFDLCTERGFTGDLLGSS